MDNINAKSISFCMTISIYKGQFIKVIGPQQNCWSCDHMINFQFMKKICLYFCLGQMILVGIESTIRISLLEALPGEGSHVARLNFKMSHVSVYKCLSLIVGFFRHCHNLATGGCLLSRFHFSRAVASFWATSLVGIYPGRASYQCRFSGL